MKVEFARRSLHDQYLRVSVPFQGKEDLSHVFEYPRQEQQVLEGQTVRGQPPRVKPPLHPQRPKRVEWQKQEPPLPLPVPDGLLPDGVGERAPVTETPLPQPPILAGLQHLPEEVGEPKVLL